METYRWAHTEENNTSPPQRSLQFAQFFATGPSEGRFDPNQRLEIDRSMFSNKIELYSVLGSSSKQSAAADSLLHMDNPSAVELILAECHLMEDDHVQVDEEFENVSLATANLPSDQLSVNQMNPDRARHTRENPASQSPSFRDGHRRRQIAMALVIISVVVAIVIIIVIGMTLSQIFPFFLLFVAT